MKIVRPYAKIVGGTINALTVIEEAARISHRSENMQTEDSWRRFIKAVVVDHGDWSVVEHASFTVEMLVDRGITHELVRHRLFSYTQESTRFVNYEKKMPPSFIYPIPEVECEYCLAGNQTIHFQDGWHHNDSVKNHQYTCMYLRKWLDAIRVAEESYKELLTAGWRPQEARSVFPNALASKIWMTGNLRNWRHFFLMRTTKEAHPQMRQVTIPLLADFKIRVPILFDDIVPESRQADNIERGR